MRTLSLLLISVFMHQVASAQIERPKLVVGIVVDQMRFDYLGRFYNKFSEGGFKRMMREGFQCKNAHYNYVPTETAPGHASIYTGTVPAIHGIVGNEWYEKGQNVYCVSDSTVKTVGANTINGEMSPRNMFVTTLGDQLKIATNQKAKVIGVSVKDRGSILPAGHTANAAFWYDRTSGKFISSTYYMSQLPGWLTRYNDLQRADVFLNQTWNTLLPIQQYTESIADDNLYERLFPGKEKPVFPYIMPEIKEAIKKMQLKQNPYDLLTYTPFGNTLVKEMVLEILRNEELGKDEFTDLLAISFSSTDIVGHAFGTHSIELEDTYLRLDKDLEEIFSELDNRLGKGNYVVFLTADHAAVEVPAFLTDLKIPAGYYKMKENALKTETYLQSLYGAGDWIVEYDDKQIYLNKALIKEKNIVLEVIQRQVAQFVLEFDGIYNTYTATDMQLEEYNKDVRNLLQNGYYQKRSGDVLTLLKPGWLPEAWSKGTSHGSPYAYDTHIPLLFYGWKIKQGQTSEPVKIIDIAPTMSVLLNIQFPSGAIGIPIEELFD